MTAKGKYPPISPGTVVKTTESKSPRSEWTDETWASRKWGVHGKVVTHHDSHGLCYDVRHEDGTEGCYDPAELEILAVHVPVDVNKIVTVTENHGGHLSGKCIACGVNGWLDSQYGYPHHMRVLVMGSKLIHGKDCPMNDVINDDGSLKK